MKSFNLQLSKNREKKKKVILRKFKEKHKQTRSRFFFLLFVRHVTGIVLDTNVKFLSEFVVSEVPQAQRILINTKLAA